MAKPVSNAVLESRIGEVEKKVDRIDSRLWLMLIGVAGGVILQLARFLFPHVAG